MRYAGYKMIVERFGLDVCDLLNVYVLTEKSQREVVTIAEKTTVKIPLTRYQVDDNWQDNLVFALKYEGVNLEVLKAFFHKVNQTEFVAFVCDKPLSAYSRRAWFLYEWLLGTRLEIEDVKSGNYCPVVDSNLQVALPLKLASRERRYRIINNLIGVRDFCPLIRLTPEIKRLSAAKLKAEAESLLAQYSPDLLYRAIRYLFVKETKSSFAIERETPTQRKMEAFVSTLGAMSSSPLDQSVFIALQNQIVDERYRQNSWREKQVYIGETMAPGYEKVHFVAVKPGDVAPLMESFLKVLEARLVEGSIDPVILAAVMSFAFVFIHPFDDGNGRIHRYLMHYILARSGFTPGEFIFPISAVLLKKVSEYDRMLETFSRRVMSRLEYVMDEDGEVSVQNDSIDYYRYVDFTPIVQKFQEFIQETIQSEWRVELEYLRDYDRIRAGMKEIVDMPEKKANQFILFTQNNGGVLPKRRREMFSELTDEEINRLEALIGGR